MSEKMPSHEELKKIQDENMTDKQIEMSNIREESLAEGEKRGMEKDLAKEFSRVSDMIKIVGIERNDKIKIYCESPDHHDLYKNSIEGYFDYLTNDGIHYGDEPPFPHGNRKFGNSIKLKFIKDIEMIERGVSRGLKGIRE